jgi:hypothetical protein
LYNSFKDEELDPHELERQIKVLLIDDDVTNKRGIYTYVLTNEEKHLNIRTFSDSQKNAAYERQNGVCTECGKDFEITEMEADHKKPWSKGGKTESNNCEMLCKNCNRTKSDK